MTDRNLSAALALVQQLQPAIAANDRARMNDVIAQLVALRAPMGGQWQQLAYLAAGNGELRLAREAIDLLVAALGGGPAAQYQKVSLLMLLDQWHEAEPLLRSLPEHVPDPASNAYARGQAALRAGRLDEARDDLERATRLQPQSGFPWFALAMATDFATAADLADKLIAAGRDIIRAPIAERIPYLYALGKLHADRGDHAAAFEAFAPGARLAKTTMRYDRVADAAEAARAVEGYSAARIAAIAAQQRAATDRTIFVTGLPRSGTTLTEQILTSHSAVTDGGETSRLLLLANEVGGPDHDALARHVQVHGVAPAARLWEHWLDELYPVGGRVVDKTAASTRHLGLAAALLPEAPLVWITRDPVDRAWSCFRTSFAGTAMPWSYDFADIAAHFRIEDQLLAQWREVLGERLLVLPYEDLVADPGPWIKRLLAHCGLAEEPQVFRPHENSRTVSTASMAQVRRPIDRGGAGAAVPYRKYMGAFLQAYSNRV